VDDTQSQEKVSCQILLFPTRRTTSLQRTEALLREAEANGRLAAAHFATCREAIDWARSFRDRCQVGIDGADLAELIRIRDALARDWADRCDVALQGA
jgi:hypothetical protein